MFTAKDSMKPLGRTAVIASLNLIRSGFLMTGTEVLNLLVNFSRDLGTSLTSSWLR